MKRLRLSYSVVLTVFLGLSAGSALAQNPTVDLFRDAATLGAPTCTVESCLNVSVDSVAQDLCAVVVFDGSSSMTQDSTLDLTQTRFEGGQTAIKEFLTNFDNSVDQFGLVQYGTNVTTTIPLTVDTNAARVAIEALPVPVDPDDLTIGELIACGLDPNGAGCPIDYTNLADGFRAGINLLSGCDPGSKPVVIVTSDGVANRATIGGSFTSCPDDPSSGGPPYSYPTACSNKAVDLTDTAAVALADVYSIAIALDDGVPFDSMGITTMMSIASNPAFYFNTVDFGGAPPIFQEIAENLDVKSISSTTVADTLDACWSYLGDLNGSPTPTQGVSGDQETLQWDLGVVPGNDTTIVCYEMGYVPNGGTCPDNPANVQVNLAGGAEFTQSDNTVQALTADTVLVDLTVCTNLPVELTGFAATATGQDVTLTWATASELNNAGFAVEHTVEGGFYQEVAFVEGNGTTNRENIYTYALNELEPGTHLFRLKQMDFDGAFEYSPVLEVDVEIPDDYYLSDVYPNPFNPQAAVRFWVARSQNVEVTLHDVTGRMVSKLYEGTPGEKSLQTIMIDGNGLSSGSYIVRMQGETFADSKTVVLLK